MRMISLHTYDLYRLHLFQSLPDQLILTVGSAGTMMEVLSSYLTENPGGLMSKEYSVFNS